MKTNSIINLITDPWIPVVRESGLRDVIRPGQVAESDVRRFDWPRADLDLACHELLIGLAYLACPPDNNRQRLNPPEAKIFHVSLEPLAPAFELLGNGPCFLQDIDELDGKPNVPDILFIDSAGESTTKKNADILVHRNRYSVLPLPLAAMALYTLQAFAPSGGSGHRTSMRGSRPMVTLVKPRKPGLWPLIWANVPCGNPIDPNNLEILPWMRPTATSEKNQVTTPNTDVMDSPSPEMFFGQPRRLQLVGDASGITGVIQTPHGTNYKQWIHHLSPYYINQKGQKLPMHLKPGSIGYNNWRGILLKNDKYLQSITLNTYPTGFNDPLVDLIVAGWSMDKMTPLDFLWSEQPVTSLDEDAEHIAISMIEAAEQAAFALSVTLMRAIGKNNTYGGITNTVQREFFLRTQEIFERRVGFLSKGQTLDHTEWLNELRKTALILFDAQVLHGLPQLNDSQRNRIMTQRKRLKGAFNGYDNLARKIYESLQLKLPAMSKRGKLS